MVNSSVSPTGPNIKDTTNTARSASYLDLLLEIESEGGEELSFKMRSNFPLCSFHLYVVDSNST
jgi:hypothetical protein